MDAVDIVEEAGFEAIEAMDADEALRILAERCDIRIVFTDIDMPCSMDGIQLARLVRERWSSVAIIVASGHHRPGPDDLPPAARFFTTPYARAAIKDALAQAA